MVNTLKNLFPRNLLKASGTAAPARRDAAVHNEQMEQLEQRQMMTLIFGPDNPVVPPVPEGTTPPASDTLPFAFYSPESSLTYSPTTGAFDISAIPTAVLLPPAPGTFALILSNPGDFQIHIRVDNSGALIGGVAGDDFVLRGALDYDFDGVADTPFQDLIRGEVLQFGYQDSGTGTLGTDDYDFRFRVTGGFLAPSYAGKDVAVITNSEFSDFAGSFAVPFSGQAKGNVQPTNKLPEVPQVGQITGYKWLDRTGNGRSSDDTGLGGVTVYLDTNNNGALDSGELSTTTAGDGSYSFGNLTPGNYIVREVVPTGFLRTQPALSDKYTVSVAAGQVVSNIDFTNAATNCQCGITGVSFLINGTTTVTNLRGNTNQGDVVTAIFTVRPGYNNSVFSLVTYTAPSASFVASEASQQRIFDLDTGTYGPGTYALTVRIPDSNYQIDFVCGEAIDQLGPAGSNIFYTPQGRLISADNDGNARVVANASSISGTVFEDLNNDGLQQVNEGGIRDVLVTLNGTDNTGAQVSITKRTAPDGSYYFGNLKPGTYQVTETQAAGYADGIDSVGSANGTLTNDRVSNIVLAAGINASDYNFGEILCPGGLVSRGETATIGFWNNTNGQNLLKSLNGSSNATALSYWLATQFPNLYGANAGSNNLLGFTNSQVASFYKAKFALNGGPKIEAQIMSAAFAVYVTDQQLAGGTYATARGFTVNSVGTAFETISTLSSGTALGLSNNISITVLGALRAANAANAGNALFSASTTVRSAVTDLFNRINTSGDIV